MRALGVATYFVFLTLTNQALAQLQCPSSKGVGADPSCAPLLKNAEAACVAAQSSAQASAAPISEVLNSFGKDALCTGGKPNAESFKAVVNFSVGAWQKCMDETVAASKQCTGNASVNLGAMKYLTSISNFCSTSHQQALGGAQQAEQMGQALNQYCGGGFLGISSETWGQIGIGTAAGAGGYILVNEIKEDDDSDADDGVSEMNE